MATQEYRIVSSDESKIHDEPHIQDSRITVRFVHGLVEGEGITPERVAEKYDIDIANVYEALAYYHSNPTEMRRVERRYRNAIEEAKRRSSLTPPDSPEDR
jgi:uncharacterized protein (DUF433 family)